MRFGEVCRISTSAKRAGQPCGKREQCILLRCVSATLGQCVVRECRYIPIKAIVREAYVVDKSINRGRHGNIMQGALVRSKKRERMRYLQLADRSVQSLPNGAYESVQALSMCSEE